MYPLLAQLLEHVRLATDISLWQVFILGIESSSYGCLDSSGTG